MSQMSQVPGPFQPLAQYAYLKNLDVPDIEEVEKAARTMLVKQGLLPPTEEDQAPPPPQPNPKDIADAKKSDAQAEKYAAEAQKTQVETQSLVEHATVRHAIAGSLMQELGAMPGQQAYPSNIPEPAPQQFIPQ
jgi:hypothetical protein